MGDHSERKDGQSKSGTNLSVADLSNVLPSTSSNIPTSPTHPVTAPQPQYQQSHQAYPVGRYQQLLPAVQSPYAPAPVDAPQFYPYVLGQQQLDTSLQPQYGGQVGYRNNPIVSPVPPQQLAAGIPRPIQQAPVPSYTLPQYQYPQPPQNLGRAMSMPLYITSQPGQSNPQFIPQTSPYSIYPSFSASPFIPDEAFPASDPETSFPRGPPRKPKQSGFALWVGNLPRDVQLEELKDFFASDGLESIFLIRKSNCAFVNYKTEESCSLALSLFHEKPFKNVRLVCRLRKSSPIRISPTTASSNVPSSIQTAEPEFPPIPLNPEPSDAATEERAPRPTYPYTPSNPSSTPGTGGTASPTPIRGPAPNRYFIMKSLTRDDLEWSVGNKSWATQPHNESTLNEAFKTSENVYLIFSVNKSGEFFGYARMASEIRDTSSTEAAKAREPGSEVAESDPPVVLAGPRTTVTPRTVSAPRGKIFEDELRGTVFWEVAESSDDEDDDPESESKANDNWGNPFRIDWFKWDTSVPFLRTRLLRNPWNGNREVKISRDGTEIEPTVGARLLKEFDVVPISSRPTTSASGIPPMPRRMSYPMTSFRPLPQPLVYQQAPPGPTTYLPYPSVPGSQPIVYNYPQGGGMPQSPQSQSPYGTPGSTQPPQSPYGYSPRHN